MAFNLYIYTVNTTPVFFIVLSWIKDYLTNLRFLGAQIVFIAMIPVGGDFLAVNIYRIKPCHLLCTCKIMTASQFKKG